MTIKEPKKPRVNSAGQRELDKTGEKFDAFEEDVKNLTMDRMNEAPKQEVEPQVQLSGKQWKEAPEVYLKPNRVIGQAPHPKTGAIVKFNEKFRASYEFDKQYVRFMAENREIGGEPITLWTRPYAGMPAEEWIVPVNKPIWGPRYLAEQIKRKFYHRLVMNQQEHIGQDYGIQTTGGVVADTTIPRLNAVSAPKQQISFNRSSNF